MCGFGVLLHRTEYGRRTTEALLAFLSTRYALAPRRAADTPQHRD